MGSKKQERTNERAGERTNKRALRKATFRVTEVKGKAVYLPVNARAHVWTDGKAVTKADLKKIARKGKVKVYIWTATGVLRKAVA